MPKVRKKGVPTDQFEWATELRRRLNETIDGVGYDSARMYTDHWLSVLARTKLDQEQRDMLNALKGTVKQEREQVFPDLMPLREIVDQIPTFAEAPQGIDANVLRAIEALTRSVHDPVMFREAVIEILLAPRPQEEVLGNVET